MATIAEQFAAEGCELNYRLTGLVATEVVAEAEEVAMAVAEEVATMVAEVPTLMINAISVEKGGTLPETVEVLPEVDTGTANE